MRTHKNRTLVLLVLVLLSLCAVPVGAQRLGGTFVVGMPFEAKTLNPNLEFDDNAFFVGQNIFDRLVTVNYRGLVVPDLAERWELSPDGMTYTFHLVNNASWHDGVRFTSADVKWTIDDQLQNQRVSYALIKDIASVEAVDDVTVRIRLTKPDSGLLYNVGSLESFVILPKHLYEGTNVNENPTNLRPVGTGPFKFVEWVRGDHYTFDANTMYFRGRPYLDRLVIKIIPNDPTRVAALEVGEIHFVNRIELTEALRLGTRSDITVLRQTLPVVFALALNMRDASFSTVAARQAIARAVNASEISEKVYAGVYPVARGFFPADPSWAFNASVRLPPYDPAAAELLLDQAGYPRGSDGIRFRTKYLGFTFLGSQQVGEVIQDNLKKVGIEITLEIVEPAVWASRAIGAGHDYNMTFIGGIQGPDPSSQALYYGTGGLQNTMGYSNPRVDELLALGKNASDTSERAKYYQEIQTIVAKDMPKVPIVDYVEMSVIRKDYSGLWMDPQQEKYNLGYFEFTRVEWTGAQVPAQFPWLASAVILAVASIVAVALAFRYTRARRKVDTPLGPAPSTSQ